MGTSHDQVANFVLAIMDHYKWTRAKLIYERNGHSEIGENFCYLAASAVKKAAQESKTKHILDWNFGATGFDKDNFRTDMNGEVGNSHAILILCASYNTTR